jgi:hypothetical protein
MHLETGIIATVAPKLIAGTLITILIGWGIASAILSEKQRKHREKIK